MHSLSSLPTRGHGDLQEQYLRINWIDQSQEPSGGYTPREVTALWGIDTPGIRAFDPHADRPFASPPILDGRVASFSVV